MHLAYDAVLDRQVAIKTLHTELGREQAFRERFRREAQAVAKLTHTNIVSVFDTGEDALDGTTMPYIVMEYVEGQPLGSVLNADVRQYGAMPADKALKITADVLAALEISHEMGLVHRDIKPGNVMMTKRGVVKVMDFGIARAMQSGVTSMTQTGMVVGTPQYLSPEQALGRGVDARSDLYSVGIMLFQLVTGRLPFDADSPLAIAYAHVQEEPVAPSSINRALPCGGGRAGRPRTEEEPERALPERRGHARRVSAGGRLLPGRRPEHRPGHADAERLGRRLRGVPAGRPGDTGADGQRPDAVPAGSDAESVRHPAAVGAFSGVRLSAAGKLPDARPGRVPAAARVDSAAVQPHAPDRPDAVLRRRQGQQAGDHRLDPGLAARGRGLVAALIMNSGREEAGGDSGPTVSASTSTKAAGYRGPDTTKVIEKTECTEPEESYNDPDQVRMPDFTFKNWDSVLACLQAAGWNYDPTRVDENTYGEDTVMKQYPTAGTDFDPKNPPEMQFDVSTGNPSS